MTDYSFRCCSALYGASFAFALLLAQKFNVIDDNNHNNLFSARVSFFVAVLALLGMIATSTYAIICPNRFEFIDIHTYFVIVPVGIVRTHVVTIHFGWNDKKKSRSQGKNGSEANYIG